MPFLWHSSLDIHKTSLFLNFQSILMLHLWVMHWIILCWSLWTFNNKNEWKWVDKVIMIWSSLKPRTFNLLIICVPQMQGMVRGERITENFLNHVKVHYIPWYPNTLFWNVIKSKQSTNFYLYNFFMTYYNFV